MRVGVLPTEAMVRRGKLLMQHVEEGSKFRGHETFRFDGSDCLLVTYGLGGDDRLPVAMAHKSKGSRFVAFDACYWGRWLNDPARPYRLAIDGFHPQDHVMRGEYPGAARWESAGLGIRQAGNVGGPIILVGNAPKSRRIGAEGWSAKKLQQIRRVFPGHRVLYRPKPKRPVEDVRADGLALGEIDDVLAMASLVVCRHSNVAVDACRLGIPVVCEDGAASAIYPSQLEAYEQQPDADRRAEFLHRLAWWQWAMAEVKTAQFWEWLEARL